MTFSEALEEMKKGKSIRRDWWYADVSLYIRSPFHLKEEIIFAKYLNKNEPYLIDDGCLELLANDWETCE